MRAAGFGVSKHTGARTAKDDLAFIIVPCMACLLEVLLYFLRLEQILLHRLRRCRLVILVLGLGIENLEIFFPFITLGKPYIALRLLFSITLACKSKSCTQDKNHIAEFVLTR